MQIVDVYKALADESRLRLIHVLSHGYFNVQELTSVLELGQSTISHHLKMLQSAGIAKNHREGTWIYYSLVRGEQASPIQSLTEPFLNIINQQQLDTELKNILGQDAKLVAKILTKRRDQTRHFFESHAAKWEEMRSGVEDDSLLLEELTKLIPTDASLLELGCGSGALFKRILPRAAQTIGVDYSQAMLDEAKQNLSGSAQMVDLRLGNLEHLPLGDDSVDMAAAYMVMHHIARPDEVLKETFRVLKNQGELVIIDLVHHENEFMRERYADLWLGFETSEFKQWVREAGFNNTELRFLGNRKQAFLLTCKKP